MKHSTIPGVSILRRIAGFPNALCRIWEPAKWGLLVIALVGFVGLLSRSAEASNSTA